MKLFEALFPKISHPLAALCIGVCDIWDNLYSEIPAFYIADRMQRTVSAQPQLVDDQLSKTLQTALEQSAIIDQQGSFLCNFESLPMDYYGHSDKSFLLFQEILLLFPSCASQQMTPSQFASLLKTLSFDKNDLSFKDHTIDWGIKFWFSGLAKNRAENDLNVELKSDEFGDLCLRPIALALYLIRMYKAFLHGGTEVGINDKDLIEPAKECLLLGICLHTGEISRRLLEAYVPAFTSLLIQEGVLVNDCEENRLDLDACGDEVIDSYLNYSDTYRWVLDSKEEKINELFYFSRFTQANNEWLKRLANDTSQKGILIKLFAETLYYGYSSFFFPNVEAFKSGLCPQPMDASLLVWQDTVGEIYEQLIKSF